MTLNPPKLSFWSKACAALALTVAADVILFDYAPGSTLGVLCLCWLAVLAIVRRGWQGDRRAQVAAGSAAILTLILIDRPSFLAWVLFGIAIMIAMQSSRVRRAEDAFRWGQRLFFNVVAAVAGPALDLARLSCLKARRGKNTPVRAVLRILILPLIGAVVFGGLFLMANPLLADLAARLRMPVLGENQFARLVFWVLVLIGVYGTLRPRWTRKTFALPERSGHSSVVPAVSVVLSLVVFNLIFAIQNGMDIAFLWSGAALPEGFTLAQYAHRGAYPLIFTSLLAGLFVLAFLRPASPTAQQPWVRRLVLLWIGQNLFLVASSILRTVNYIDVYSLTRLRIAALVWMVLVGIGLVLICWRLFKNRSGSWLVNANALTAGVVLVAISATDLGAVAASWNVRHAREMGGRGTSLDLCYLAGLHGASAVSLARLEKAATDPVFKERIAGALAYQTAALKTQQSDWHSWRWRDARRLDRVLTINPAASAPRPLPFSPDCDAEWID